MKASGSKHYAKYWYPVVNGCVTHVMQNLDDLEDSEMIRLTAKAIGLALHHTPETERDYINALLEGKTAKELSNDKTSKRTIEKMYNRFIYLVGHYMGF